MKKEYLIKAAFIILTAIVFLPLLASEASAAWTACYEYSTYVSAYWDGTNYKYYDSCTGIGQDYFCSGNTPKYYSRCPSWCTTGCGAPSCDSHSYRDCYGGDAYWYDSCGVRENVADYCSSCEYCSWGYCYSYCSGSDTSCGCTSCTNCNSSDGCIGVNYYNYYCSGTSCTYSISYNDSRCCQSQGSTCSYNSECCSGYCVDGRCCNWACNGTCMRCNYTDGICRYIAAGTDPNNECYGTGTCGGTCNGSGACQFPSSSTKCSSLLDCDYKNYYYQSPSGDSPTGTDKCYYRDYVDQYRYCSGTGYCSSLNCSSYSNYYQYECGYCKYIPSSWCTGSSRDSCANYSQGTSCGTNKECNGNGSCVTCYYPTGSISASKTSVETGETFTISVTGKDDHDVYYITYNKDSNTWNESNKQKCSLTQTECTRSWDITENTGGTYTYYGWVQDSDNSGGHGCSSDHKAGIGSVTVTVAQINSPTARTDPADNIEETTAILKGCVTDTGGADYTVRFQWGDTSSYGSNSGWTSYYDYTTCFTLDISGLTRGKTYHFRIQAYNSAGYGYGSDRHFTTKPNAPSSLSATAVSDSQIDLSWSKGSGAYYTMVRRKTGSYPTSPSDGTQAYYGTGTSKSDTGLAAGTTYYYRAWSRGYEEGYYSDYSDSYSSDYATTQAAAEDTKIDCYFGATTCIFDKGEVVLGESVWVCGILRTAGGTAISGETLSFWIRNDGGYDKVFDVGTTDSDGYACKSWTPSDTYVGTKKYILFFAGDDTYNESQTSEYSLTVTTPCSGPANFIWGPIDDIVYSGQFKISWDSVTGASTYRLEWCEEGYNFGDSGCCPNYPNCYSVTSATEKEVYNLTPCKMYSWRVRVETATGCGTPGEWSNMTTLKICPGCALGYPPGFECGFIESQSAASCILGYNNSLVGGSAFKANCYDVNTTLCMADKCPSPSNSPSSDYLTELQTYGDGSTCNANVPSLTLDFMRSRTGVWDASEYKCIRCSGKFENKICGDEIKLYASVDTDVCTRTGDGQCELACEASEECDELSPGDSCGTGKECDSSCQCVTFTQPDLVITNVELRSDKKVHYTIKNQGTALAGSSKSSLDVDGSYKTYDGVSSLSAGESRDEVFLNWTCTPCQTYSIKVCADKDNGVEESNEGNNCLTRSLHCPEKPDLVITDFNDDDEDGIIEYTIKNQGAFDAGESDTKLYIDGILEESDPVSSLTGGEEKTSSFDYNWIENCTPPSDTIKVCADDNDDVEESNEDNNCRTETWDCRCLIDEVLYDDGECDPTNKCQYCDIDKSTDSWSDVDSGYICVDSDIKEVSSTYYCNYDENCDIGDCSATEWYTSCNGSGSCRSASDHTDSYSETVYASPGYSLTSACGTSGTILCDSTWKASSGTGDNHYGKGGTYTCQGMCDGSGLCEYAVNCGVCAGTLNVSIAGVGTCTVTASLTATDCDGKFWEVRDDGTTKCSGTVSGNDYSYTCPDWTVEVGAYTYNLYIDGEWQDSGSVTCQAEFDFSIAIDPSSGSAMQGDSVSATVILTLASGTTQDVSFYILSGLPEGASVSFDPPSCSPSCSSIMTINTSATTPTGNYSINVCGTSGDKTHCVTYSLTVIEAGVEITPPEVTTAPATNIAQTSATLNGILNSTGNAETCLVWFEWGTSGTEGVSGSYGNSTTPVPMTATGSFMEVISGLSPGITYFFEAFAKNGGSW